MIEAAPQKDFRRKPIAPDVRVKVLRGRSIVIRLPGVESNGNPIRYQIVSSPSSGKLSELEQPDPNRQGHGFVTYTHGDDETSLEDEFQYQVATPINGLTSSPGVVRIHIVDPPPVLGAPSFLTFTAVVGESSTSMLSLTNVGGSVLQGRVHVSPPFYLDADGAFALKRGQSTNLPLRYSPTETGLSAPEKIQPIPDAPGASITLRGEATAPFSVKTTAERLDLKADDSRSISVELANLSSLPQSVNVSTTTSDLLENIPAIPLAPGESREVLLRIPPENKGAAKDFSVTFSTQAYSQSRVFNAPSVPARLEVLTEEIDFTSSRDAMLVVRNSGGVEGRFSISLPVTLTALEGAAAFSVPPNQEKSVRLHLSSKKDTDSPVELTVTTSAGKSERVAIRTAPEESPEATPATPSQVPLPTPMPTPPQPGIPNDNVRFVKDGDRQYLKWNLPPGWSDVRAEAQNPGTATWRVPSPPPEAGGWWDGITSIPLQILGFFSNLTSRENSNTIGPDTPSVPNSTADRPGVEISGDDVNSGGTWRLTARSGETGERAPVTDEFVINAKAGLLNVLRRETPPEEKSPETNIPTTRLVPQPPFTPIIESQQELGKKSATILLAIPQNPEIDGYRLERLASETSINPATGLPGPVNFRVIPHDGDIEIIAQYPMRRDGRDLSVITFSIEGLPPNAGTFWRLVPIAGNRDLPPTGEFMVKTLPSGRISWSSVLFWSALALLLALFYLRWKSRRPPIES